MDNFTTKDISAELIKRAGITHIVVEPYETVKIVKNSSEQELTGPAIIIINQD